MSRGSYFELKKDGSSILRLEFNSMFSSLREHYEDVESLNTYLDNCTHVISAQEAEDMLRAIDYILLGKYDKEVSDIIGKTFIEIFGELDREYSLWSYRQTFPNDVEYTGSDIDDCRDSLRHIRTMLDAYMIALEDDSGSKYELSYTMWG